MNFRPSYPIYRQVADLICEKVLTAAWRDGVKLPAVKDLAALTSVNPNTVNKALTWLVEHDILTAQRGVGYFLSEGAATKTLALKREQFIGETLPEVFASMALLDLDLHDLATLHKKHQRRVTS